VLRVTLDTSAVNGDDLSRINTACAGHEIEIVHTTVTDREQEGTGFATSEAEVMETGVWDESRWDKFVWGSRIPETLVLGESRLGSAALGSDDAPVRFEAILAIINGNRQFPSPGRRDALTKKQRARLRDAMIFEAHARERRDVFVTNDRKDFIRHGRREQPQALCSTEILTVDEFVARFGGRD
jgi:hypothetical protein